MAEVVLKNIKKAFGDVEVIKGVDLNIEDREFVVFVGPSGCGKSTLLRMIAGLESITDGDLSIDGRRVNDLSPAERGIAMVFQTYALYPHMTVRDNMGFSLRLAKAPKGEIDRKVTEAARILKLDHLLDRKPKALSGGQRQRVAIGRAIVRNPKVFLFDEPLSNLDAKLRVDMRTEIKKLHHRLGRTTVYVTHDQIEALTLSTRIAVMNKGHVQQLGTPREIYDRPANTFVASFMGNPSMNLMPARIVVQDGAPHAQVTLEGASRKLLRLGQPALAAQDGREVILGLRPEAITDEGGADCSARLVEQVDHVVSVVEPAGADTFASFAVGGRNVVARLRANAAPRVGQSFPFRLNMDKAVVFDPKTEARIGD